jgi:hypothetical protein
VNPAIRGATFGHSPLGGRDRAQLTGAAPAGIRADAPCAGLWRPTPRNLEWSPMRDLDGYLERIGLRRRPRRPGWQSTAPTPRRSRSKMSNRTAASPFPRSAGPRANGDRRARSPPPRPLCVPPPAGPPSRPSRWLPSANIPHATRPPVNETSPSSLNGPAKIASDAGTNGLRSPQDDDIGLLRVGRLGSSFVMDEGARYREAQGEDLPDWWAAGEQLTLGILQTAITRLGPQHRLHVVVELDAHARILAGAADALAYLPRISP